MKEITIPKMEWLMDNSMFEENCGKVHGRLNERSRAALDRLFGTMRRLRPHENGEWRSIMIKVRRGELSDFGDYRNYLECGEVKNMDEFMALWKWNCPSDKKWYLVQTVEVYNGYRALCINRKIVIQLAPHIEEGWQETDFTEELEGIEESVKKMLEKIKAGSYSEYLYRNLPFTMRFGKILRKDFFDLFPSKRRKYFGGLPRKTLKEFHMYASSPWDPKTSEERLGEMTAGIFFRMCNIFYEVNKYPGKELSPGERYCKNGYDFRSDLMDLDENSPEEYEKWYHLEHYDGHPYRINKGGSFTTVNFWPVKDSKGYYFVLSGPADCSLKEVIRFYVELRRMNIPVDLDYLQSMVDRINEEDYIGIVPEHLNPYYFRWDISEGIYHRINLPLSRRNKLIEKTIWDPIPEADAQLEKD